MLAVRSLVELVVLCHFECYKSDFESAWAMMRLGLDFWATTLVSVDVRRFSLSSRSIERVSSSIYRPSERESNG
jgi:hypothetical protein